jgi:hypothetical protein
MKEFKIRFHSGLGDCFRMLTEQPSIKMFHETYGLKIHWVYDRCGVVQNLPAQRYTDYPLQFVMQEILQNVDFFNPVSYEEYVSLQVTELNNWKLENKAVDQLQGIFPTEIPGFDIPMSVPENAELENLLAGTESAICVQLTGKDEKKNYSPDNYRQLFELILHNYPRTKIFLIDTPDKKVHSSLLFDNRIFDLTSKFTLVQQINLIKRADFLIAPDSYSKYIRRWANGKQTILCTSLDYISNQSLMLGCFGDYTKPYTAGLLFNPDVTLLGVKYTVNLNNLEIVDNINDISPEEIFKSINL